MEQVVLVDEHDKVVGTMEKLEAHRKGALHRAFSILLFNSNGELLLQKRAQQKYHSAGLWTNTCCSHPRPDEKMEEAVSRKLRHEMGIDVKMEFAYKFIYKAELDSSLIEHEMDYVYVGEFDGKPFANKEEVEDWKYISLQDLKEDVRRHPGNYTHWFKLILEAGNIAELA